LRKLEQAHLQVIVSKLGPHQQRDLAKTLRHFAGFCISAGLIDRDPTAGLRLAKRKKSDGWRTWSEDDIAKFEAVHPVGSTARLALHVMLYTGLRRADAVRLGPPHVRGGVVRITPQKTAHSTAFELEVPVHPVLGATIAATPTTGLSNFIIGRGGKPLKAETFGSYMRRWCDEAGLPEVSAHGLRKAVCRRLIEAEAPPHMIMALTGHTDVKQLEPYTRTFDRARLARRAVDLMIGRR